MTTSVLLHILTAILTFNLCYHIIHAEQSSNPSSNQFLKHLFKKYGSQNMISFEGFEHLMHNLGIGDLDFPHTLDEHRSGGYKVPEIVYETTTYENVENDNEAIATTIPADKVIKINPLDNKQEDIFHTMHDKNHRHPRHRDHAGSSHKKCLSPISLMKMYNPDAVNASLPRNPIYRSSVLESDGAHQHDHSEEREELNVSNIQITPTTLLNMCPALLVQIEQGSYTERHQHVEATHATVETKKITAYAWIAAVVSITIISLCGLIGIAMVPLTKFSGYHDILRFMIAIAIGTLVGDALMHLIPHALMPHTHSNANQDLSRHGGHAHNVEHNTGDEKMAVWLCGCAFMTALFMYFIESFLPLVSGNNGHGHSHGGHGHGPQISNKVQAKVMNTDECHQPSENHSSNCGSCEDLDNDLESSKKNNEENVMVKDTKVRPLGALSPVAFMVIIGDGLHNLTDGMAIGAAFGVAPVTGMATALAVLCHELPHELGDFALLLQTGVSLRRAFVFNVISSVLSFIGMVVGLLIVNANSEFVRWIYAGTAGTFLYIAFADLVPELGRAEQSIKMTIIQSLGIFLGGIIMLCIGLYEDRLEELFRFE